MSAIFGTIYANEKLAERKSYIQEHFRKKYETYAIDSIDITSFDVGFLGCGIQYFNEQSRYEKLPINDSEHDIIFTADCVLDNREELMSQLHIGDNSITDGSLIYKSYLEWGIDCLKHLRGVYAFVIYDRSVRKIYLCNDHFASRCLFYTIREGVLYFSTLLFPLIEASEINYEINDRWIVDCMSVRGPMMMTETRECAYKDVYKVDSGFYVEVDYNFNAKYVQYWNPILKNKVDEHIRDDECGKKIKSILDKSVRACVRSDSQVGIQLSSGLDSTTIAGFAAPILEEQGKKLYSFTSVPLKESGVKNERHYIVDETQGVNEICDMYPNIQPSFIDSRGLCILNMAEEIVDVWELPCKSQQNAVWIANLCKVSREAGCRIMLSGSTGNCTISSGRWEDYFVELIHKLKFVSLYRQFKYFSSTHTINGKAYGKYIIKEQIRYRKDILTKKYSDYYEEFYRNIATRKDIGDKYEVVKRFKGISYLTGPTKNRKKMQQEIYYPLAYAQIGEIDTKLSLAYGVLQRDPLRNVELVEYCLQLPMRCYVDSTYNRKLVRKHMKGIIPDSIREDYLNRGLQGADNNFRVNQLWNDFERDIKRSFKDDTLSKYMDQKKIVDITNNKSDIGLVLDCYTLGIYIKRVTILL